MITDDKALYNKLIKTKNALVSLASTPAQARRRLQGDPLDVDAFLGPACDEFDLDVYKLQHSKAMRRLANKTQVFPDPKSNYHIRTRLIHTIEVASIAGVITDILGLNTQLAQAIALGHDIGHPPFGHIGEEFLTNRSGKKFRHEIFASIVAQQIERETRGLNLSFPTLQGIVSHSRGKNEMTLSSVSPEADVVMFADKIAYCFSDISDIFKRGYLNIGNFPEIKEMINWFGPFQRARTGKCIVALCVESAEKGAISFTDSETAKNFAPLKTAMYTVYPLLNRNRVIEPILAVAFDLISEKIPDIDPVVLLALMTDSEVFHLNQTEFQFRDVEHMISTFSVSEIMPFIRDKHIDFTSPDLDW